MQHHRSIGLTDLVALMASHRAAVARDAAQPGVLDPWAFERISAYLRNADRGLAPRPRPSSSPPAAGTGAGSP